MNFLVIDDCGGPDTSPEYAEAIGALYAVACALKFRVKKGSGGEYVVVPLESL